jgi:hypothetical protein
MPRGWIIEVQFVERDRKWLQRYDVAISDPEEAIAAVWRRLGRSDGASITVVEELFDATFYGLGLVPGDILPRVRFRR